MTVINQEKLTKLKDLLKLADSGLTRSEFTAAFKALTDFIKKTKEELGQQIDTKTQKALNDLAELYQRYLLAVNKVEAEAERIKTDNESTLSNIKKWALEKVSVLFLKSQVNSELTKRLKEVEIEFNKISEKADEIRGFEPPDTSLIAKTASDLAITAVLSQLPKSELLSEELPKQGDLIASALELLPEEDKLKVSAVKGLEEILEELRKLRGRSLGGGGFSVGALDIHIADPYAPTGTIDGANTDFTLISTPSPAASLKVYRGGALQSLTEDYTLSGTTITFLIAPVVGEIIKVEHRR